MSSEGIASLFISLANDKDEPLLDQTVAIEIQRELQGLPIRAKPRLVMMDAEYWERFTWEIMTEERYINTEIKRVWSDRVVEYRSLGRTGSDIKSIWCPDMGICFFRNPYIQKIRVTYTRR
jgi:hypothetical protein